MFFWVTESILIIIALHSAESTNKLTHGIIYIVGLDLVSFGRLLFGRVTCPAWAVQGAW
jgi:hypothetical protein